jgi:hypothetical protein
LDQILKERFVTLQRTSQPPSIKIIVLTSIKL